MKPKLMATKQNGMAMVSWLVVLGVVFSSDRHKMIPTYLENYSIKQVLTNMENDRAVRSMSPAEMKQSFLKRLKINSVYKFDRNAILRSRRKRMAPGSKSATRSQTGGR